MVTIRFTILFLRVSIRLGSLKCKQSYQLAANYIGDYCMQKKYNLRSHKVVLLHDYFMQVITALQCTLCKFLMTVIQKHVLIAVKPMCH